MFFKNVIGVFILQKITQIKTFIEQLLILRHINKSMYLYFTGMWAYFSALKCVDDKILI